MPGGLLERRGAGHRGGFQCVPDRELICKDFVENENIRVGVGPLPVEGKKPGRWCEADSSLGRWRK